MLESGFISGQIVIQKLTQIDESRWRKIAASRAAASRALEDTSRRDRRTVRRTAANNARPYRVNSPSSTISRERSSRKRCRQRDLAKTKSPGLASGASVSFETASLFRNEKSDRLGRHGTESQRWRGSPNQMYESRRAPAPEASEEPRSTRLSRQDRHTNR